MTQPPADASLLFKTGDAAEDTGDFAFAKSAFERGAALGDQLCWLRLGLLFDLGKGLPVDKAEAMRCYRRAWLSRNPAAANNIAVLYRERGDDRGMLRWYKKAAAEGDGSAHLDVAKCYLRGVGARANTQAGLRSLAAAVASDFISEAEREEAQALLDDLRPCPVSPAGGD